MYGVMEIVIAGFWLSLRLSPFGSLMTGLVAGVAISFLSFLENGFVKASFLAVWISPALGTIPAFFLANRFDSIKALLLIIPLGALLILVGGPIGLIEMWIN